MNRRIRRQAAAACAVLGSVLMCSLLSASQPSSLRAAIASYVQSHQRAIVNELIELLSIPNVSADREHIRQNAISLRSLLEKHGLRAEVLETDGNPLVFGELRVPVATRTVLFYAHYDGQPVDPKGWKQRNPFVPVLRDGRMEDGGTEIGGLETLQRFDPNSRIYARSSSDDKSPIVILCAALDGLRATGLAPTSAVKVVLDGEEEAGSPSLVPAIARYRDKLAADLMVILDGPVHPSNKPTMVFGARGILTLQLTVYGPKFGLHSGHYGNWVPNPGMRLARLLTSMKDDHGRVLVEGFYDGVNPLDPVEQAMLDQVPDEPASLMRLFGIAEPERAGLSLQDALQLPSLNVRGLSSAYVDADARTIIPDRAIAEIDIRLVKETPADTMLERVRAHIRGQGYHIVESEPDDRARAAFARIVRVVVGDRTNAYRTSPLLPISRLMARALEHTYGGPPIQIRTSGGTVPIAPFIEAMGFPAISVPTVNFDNNQHGENENLRLGHFFEGITTVAAVLRM